MTVLLDTTVLIDALRDRKGRRGFLSQLLREGHSLACCPVNVAEVYSGMRPREAAATGDFLGGLDYIDISRAAAKKAGLLQAEWKAKGHTLALADTLVAAVAMTEGLTLATDNVKHYPMAELKLLPLPA
jgi:predicted nucleic acid-binding protein